MYNGLMTAENTRDLTNLAPYISLVISIWPQHYPSKKITVDNQCTDGDNQCHWQTNFFLVSLNRWHPVSNGSFGWGRPVGRLTAWGTHLGPLTPVQDRWFMECQEYIVVVVPVKQAPHFGGGHHTGISEYKQDINPRIWFIYNIT